MSKIETERRAKLTAGLSEQGVGPLGSKPDPIVGLHYQLHGYVCGKGCIKPSPFEGAATFTQIFQKRPDGCRFAVAQCYGLERNPTSYEVTASRHPSGPFVCWDLLDDELVKGRRTGPSGLIMPPPPLWMGPSADGLIMKAVHLYDQE